MPRYLGSSPENNNGISSGVFFYRAGFQKSF